MIGVDPTGSILLETWQRGQIPTDVKATAYKVEGIGEDFLPTTLDLSVIDDVIRTTDKEAFLWTRRLVKEEGIFCGGSSGAAVAAAVRYARQLPPERVVVVILPDSGSRYLSKIFDDKWMRENGFLDSAWREITLGDVLAVKASQRLITVSPSDSMTDVIARLKEFDISQLPVVQSDGSLAGMVTEVDLLKHMLASGHSHTSGETIAGIIQAPPPAFPAYSLLEEALPLVMEGQVILVSEAGRPTGILTKIDVLDYIAQEI